MLSFGPYKFTPINLKYSKENRWSVIECIDKMPSLQNIGQGVENIDLEGITYLHNPGNLSQLNSAKKQKNLTLWLLIWEMFWDSL